MLPRDLHVFTFDLRQLEVEICNTVFLTAFLLSLPLPRRPPPLLLYSLIQEAQGTLITAIKHELVNIVTFKTYALIS